MQKRARKRRLSSRYDINNGKTFIETFGPSGVMHSWATNVDDPTVDPRFGRVGKQRIEDTGPSQTKKRMETIDEESLAAAKDFITRQVQKPFFVDDGQVVAPLSGLESCLSGKSRRGFRRMARAVYRITCSVTFQFKKGSI